MTPPITATPSAGDVLGDIDPSRVMKCECGQTGELNPAHSDWYDEETELPFVDHAPGECACVNDLAKYRSRDGVVRWLCSCCCMFGDTRISDSEGLVSDRDTAP